jgi:hypothetical protein
MAGETFKVGRASEAVAVQGFPGKATAHRHVTEHFFNKKERWEQLCETNPGRLAARWREAADLAPKNQVLDEASAVYQAVIRSELEGEGSVRVEQFLYLQGYERQPSETVGVIGKRGIFAVFKQAPVSVLRTSYRPLPRSHRGVARVRDYFNGANEKLNRLLARSQELLRPR